MSSLPVIIGHYLLLMKAPKGIWRIMEKRLGKYVSAARKVTDGRGLRSELLLVAF